MYGIKKKSLIPTLATIALAILLTACGKGSGDNDDTIRGGAATLNGAIEGTWMGECKVSNGRYFRTRIAITSSDGIIRVSYPGYTGSGCSSETGSNISSSWGAYYRMDGSWMELRYSSGGSVAELYNVSLNGNSMNMQRYNISNRTASGSVSYYSR